jgi:hypothetical protein
MTMRAFGAAGPLWVGGMRAAVRVPAALASAYAPRTARRAHWRPDSA